MSEHVNRDALIHDLAIVLAGSLHPKAQIGPAPRLAAHRLRDVLGIEDGEMTKSVEARILAALADTPHGHAHPGQGPIPFSAAQRLIAEAAARQKYRNP